MRFTVTALSAAFVLLACGIARADVALTNHSLTVGIRTDNGAINGVTFGGSDYYNPGIPVSNWGLQSGTATSSFVLNTTTGGAGQSVTVASVGESVIVTGTYTGGGADVDFTRTYALVPDRDVLRISMVFVNYGADLTLSLFDTLDPDQGVDQGHGNETYNDVFLLSTQLGTARVGRAAESGGLSVVMGSRHPSVAVASGSPFRISTGSLLNGFFSAPHDGDGAFADEGTHVGLRAFLASGSSIMFTYDQAYGPTPEKARDEFLAANIPAPGAGLLGLIGLAIVGGLKHARTWRRKHAPPGGTTA